MSRAMLLECIRHVDHGELGIIQRNVAVSAGRHRRDNRAEVSLKLSPGRANTGDIQFLSRLQRAVEDQRALLEHVRNSYDRRDSIEVEIEFVTDGSTLEWMLAPYDEYNSDMERRRTRGRRDRIVINEMRARDPVQWVGDMDRLLRDRAVQRPTAAPPAPAPRDDRADALAYSMRALGLTNLAAEEIVRREVVQAYDRTSNIANIPIRGVSGGLMIIDDPLVPEGEVVVSNMSCKIGDLDSHKWVEVPNEGPTAKRCSACLRVTGQFWTPDDRRQAIEWLNTNVKILVCLWANSIDTMALRYSLIETDLSVKHAEEPASNDTDARFALLELK